jgi:hypothetical protein
MAGIVEATWPRWLRAALSQDYRRVQAVRASAWDASLAPIFAASGVAAVISRNLHRMLWWWPLALPVVAGHTYLVR